MPVPGNVFDTAIPSLSGSGGTSAQAKTKRNVMSSVSAHYSSVGYGLRYVLYARVLTVGMGMCVVGQCEVAWKVKANLWVVLSNPPPIRNTATGHN